MNKRMLLKPELVYEYMKRYHYFPKVGEFLLMILDAKLQLININYHCITESFISIMKKSYVPKMSGVMIIYHCDQPKCVIDAFRLLGIDIVDIFYIKNYTLIGYNSKEVYGILPNIRNDFINNKPIIYPNMDNLINHTLKDLLIGTFMDTINFKLLKVIELFKNLDQEYFVLMMIDYQKRVREVLIPFKGGLNSSIVDPRVLIKYFVDDNFGFCVMFHNHPSGIVDPSKEDLMITERFKAIMKLFNKELYAHYILGRYEIYEIINKKLLDITNKVL